MKPTIISLNLLLVICLLSFNFGMVDNNIIDVYLDKLTAKQIENIRIPKHVGRLFFHNPTSKHVPFDILTNCRRIKELEVTNLKKFSTRGRFDIEIERALLCHVTSDSIPLAILKKTKLLEISMPEHGHIPKGVDKLPEIENLVIVHYNNFDLTDSFQIKFYTLNLCSKKNIQSLSLNVRLAEVDTFLNEFENLKHLDLDWNQISNLDKISFWKLKKLEHLSLCNNPRLRISTVDIFQNCDSLKELFLPPYALNRLQKDSLKKILPQSCVLKYAGR